jgi:hypothetical protein
VDPDKHSFGIERQHAHLFLSAFVDDACRAKSFSAKKELGALVRMMPLDVMVPTTTGMTLALPPTGITEKAHNPFGDAVTIAGIRDEVVVMASLQRPKKV